MRPALCPVSCMLVSKNVPLHLASDVLLSLNFFPPVHLRLSGRTECVHVTDLFLWFISPLSVIQLFLN